MKKRAMILGAILCAAVSAIGLAGCGSTEPVQESAESQVVASEPAESSKAEESSQPEAPAEDGIVGVYHMTGIRIDDGEGVQEYTLDEFAARHAGQDMSAATSAVVEFKEDGTGTMDNVQSSGTMTWTIDGNNITMTEDNGSVQKAVLEGDKIFVPMQGNDQGMIMAKN